MKKKLLSVLITGLFFLSMTGMANAALTTIGTATYGGSDYNLIWDNNNNGNSVVWLDYTNYPHAPAWWWTQIDWAAGLDSSLTYDIDAAYTVSWSEADWRLPSAGADPEWGYGKIHSEMGHLFFNELGLSSDATAEQLNATNFDNLIASTYWSGTVWAGNPGSAWQFSLTSGIQEFHHKDWSGYGLAVRSGQVSAVPVPGAIWLLGSGMAGLVALGRRRKGNRV